MRRRDASAKGPSNRAESGAQAIPAGAPLGQGLGGLEDGGLVPHRKCRGQETREVSAVPGRSGRGESTHVPYGGGSARLALNDFEGGVLLVTPAVGWIILEPLPKSIFGHGTGEVEPSGLALV